MMGAKLVIDRYGLDGNSQESQEERTSDSIEARLGDKLTVLINEEAGIRPLQGHCL